MCSLKLTISQGTLCLDWWKQMILQLQMLVSSWTMIQEKGKLPCAEEVAEGFYYLNSLLWAELTLSRLSRQLHQFMQDRSEEWEVLLLWWQKGFPKEERGPGTLGNHWERVELWLEGRSLSAAWGRSRFEHLDFQPVFMSCTEFFALKTCYCGSCSSKTRLFWL